MASGTTGTPARAAMRAKPRRPVHCSVSGGPSSSRAPPGKISTERPASSAATAGSSAAGMVLTLRRSQPTSGARWSEVPRFSMTWISGQVGSVKKVKIPSSIVSA